jgi:ABC-2 type transport system ATP-binding protein
VFFSSHILTEVERVCDRVAMLRSGRLVAVGTINSVLGSQRRRVRATFSAPVDTRPLAQFGEVAVHTETTIEMLVARDNVAAFVRHLGALPLNDLTVEPASLEDAFLEYYR